jgi:hypothetical protein
MLRGGSQDEDRDGALAWREVFYPRSSIIVRASRIAAPVGSLLK